MLYIYTNETHWFNHHFNLVTGLISRRMQIIKKLFCSHFSVNKGLIQQVVQSCYNYNIAFRKLEFHTVKMRPISACYTSGRGARRFLGIGRSTNSRSISYISSNCYTKRQLKFGNLERTNCSKQKLAHVSNCIVIGVRGRIQPGMNGLQIKLSTNFTFTAENPYNLPCIPCQATNWTWSNNRNFPKLAKNSGQLQARLLLKKNTVYVLKGHLLRFLMTPVAYWLSSM